MDRFAQANAAENAKAVGIRAQSSSSDYADMKSMEGDLNGIEGTELLHSRI
jgi:hypothetical protein